MRWRGMILWSQKGHRWQYCPCVVHAGYLRLKTHTHVVQYSSLFHINSDYTNAPHCHVTLHRLLCQCINYLVFKPFASYMWPHSTAIWNVLRLWRLTCAPWTCWCRGNHGDYPSRMTESLSYLRCGGDVTAVHPREAVVAVGILPVCGRPARRRCCL